VFENVRNFVADNLVPAYQAYVAQRKARKYGRHQLLRLGMDAAVALYHLREHLPKEKRPSYDEIVQCCPDYAIVRDIANIRKHGKLDGKRYKPLISTPDHFFEALIYTQFQDEQGEYWATDVEVYVRLDDKTERTMTDLLVSAMRFWQNRLEKIGVGKLANIPVPSLQKVVSRLEAAQDRVSFELVQKQQNRLRVQVRRYNNDKACFEPVDLRSYTSAEFRLWKAHPTITVPFSIVPVDDGKPIQGEKPLELAFEFPVSPAQKAMVDALEAFPDEQQAIIEMLFRANPELVTRLTEMTRCGFEAREKRKRTSP